MRRGLGPVSQPNGPISTENPGREMMAIPTYQPGAIARAKLQGLHLMKIEIMGKHAKQGSMAMSAVVGPAMAKRLKQLFVDLSDVEKRMK